MVLGRNRDKNYSKWYHNIILKSHLADISGVRGCIILKPYGFSIWEKMQSILDKILKKYRHENAYFPILIPKNLFSKELDHIHGFSKECAIITHYRLKYSTNVGVLIDENAKLQEELIVRPTSETIIWNSYNKWIKSYRDLPILMNQWANVVRWEMHPRMFLRTSEFLWQEGHTAHSNRQEAIHQSKKILDIYKDFSKNFLAIPVISGTKTCNERFAGAEITFCLESIMQDGKSIQVGTSHYLGEKFAKAFDVKFTDYTGNKKYVWGTSWGVSTRLIGALIMTHSDDYGLVLPPNIAPIQIVIIPIYKKIEQFKQVNKIIISLKKSLIIKKISVIYDNREYHTPGWKFNEYEIKGIPIRISIGPKNIKDRTVEIFRRDKFKKEIIKSEYIDIYIPKLLGIIQNNMYKKALTKSNSLIYYVNSYDELKKKINEKNGFISAHWDGTSESEKKIKIDTQAKISCIPIEGIQEEGYCIISGKKSNKRVLLAKSY
jgi:prolyl-tRNA synthetase